MAIVTKNKPNTSTWETRVYLPAAGAVHTEYDDEQEAKDAALHALRTMNVDQVTIVGWRHERNMPGCLPEVRAYSVSMTVYKLVENPVDIHGYCY